eukprot:Skav200006  [mRNA]  locus=scaffold4475:53793:54881:+ [translate_table: standard]
MYKTNCTRLESEMALAEELPKIALAVLKKVLLTLCTIGCTILVVIGGQLQICRLLHFVVHSRSVRLTFPTFPCCCHVARAGFGCHGAQIESVQEGTLQVSLEVEEEANSQVAKETPQDASTIQVKR